MAEFPWGEETYTEGAGGDFISEADFNKLIYTDAVVQIVGVREGMSPGFNGGAPQAQYLVDFVDPEGEDKTKGFAKSNEERNSRIARIATTLEATGEPVEASFIKVGRRNDIGAPKVKA